VGPGSLSRSQTTKERQPFIAHPTVLFLADKIKLLQGATRLAQDRSGGRVGDRFGREALRGKPLDVRLPGQRG